MRTISLMIIVVLLAIIPLGCRKGGTWGIQGTGNNITETRPISGFTGIKLCMDADVIYTQDSVFLVEISAQKNILAVMRTEMQGTDLVFDYRREIHHANKVIINIHSPNINKLMITGSGNISLNNKLIGNKLELNISGSGNISVPSLSVQNLVSKISGSGNINVTEGIADNSELSISGSGSIKTEHVSSKNSTAKISGSGNLTLTALEKLNVTIAGSGNVKYHGSPTVSAEIEGSGKLIALD